MTQTPNPEKGEFLVTIAGTPYIFVLNTLAMRAAERQADVEFGTEVSFDELMAKLQRGSMRAFTVFCWAMLQTHHPTLTPDGMAAVIDTAGGIVGLKDLVLAEAYKASRPDPTDMEALGGKTPRPPKSQPSGRRAKKSGAHSSFRRVTQG